MDYITELTAIASEHCGIIETKIAAQRGISKAMLYNKYRKQFAYAKDIEYGQIMTVLKMLTA